MSECAWVALVEDKETGLQSCLHFRYASFSSENEAAKQFELQYPQYYVIQASTNPYLFKGFSPNANVGSVYANTL